MSIQPSPSLNQDSVATNGRAGGPVRHSSHVQPLDYLLARHSPAVYRAIHTAKAQRDEAGAFAAKRRLALAAFDRLKSQPTPRIAIEELRPETSAKEAAEQFVATTPLAAPVEGIRGLVERVEQLDQLRRGQPSAVLTELVEITRPVAARQFANLEPCLADAVALAPFAAREWLTAAQRHLEGLNYPKPTKHGLARLANIVARLRSLQQDPTALPPHKRAAIEQRLVHVGHAATIAALREIACDRTIAVYRDHANALRTQLAAWQTQLAACDQHLAAVAAQLDAEATQHQHRQARQSKAGLTLLDGPSEERVLEVLSKELSSQGEELAAKILELWMSDLAEEAAEEFGQVVVGRPGELLSRVDAAHGLLALHRVVDQHLCELSLYATLRTVGIERFAEELYAKAAPLVQMERQSVELGLEFIDAAVLVVPAPDGSDDGRTLAMLKNALSAHGSVELRIAASRRAELRLTRTLSGFPAAAQSINRANLWAYAKSRKLHHFPHVMNLVPDSPDGRASEAAVAIVQSHRQSHGVNRA